VVAEGVWWWVRVANGIEVTAGRLLIASYQDCGYRAGVEYFAPRDAASAIELERFSEEVEKAIEYLERNGYMVDVGRRLNTEEGSFYQITPRGLDWLGVGP
jgi:hypothetical protein